jgi:hypothetical protein
VAHPQSAAHYLLSFPSSSSDQQEFGEARLAELLVTEINKPLDNIITVVTSAVGKWIHDPEGRDDLTLVLLRKL